MKRSGPPARRSPLRRAAQLPASGAVRRSQRRNLTAGGVDAETREFVIRRDRGCVATRYGVPGYCNGALQVHHRLPRGMGGTSDPHANDPDRLICLCAHHHGWVESNRTAAYDLGLLLRHGAS